MGRAAASVTQIDGVNYPTAVQYDALGRAAKSQDATGNWARTEYTSRGFAAAVCFSSAADANPSCATPWQRTHEIDAWGHVVREVRSSSGQLSITRQYHPVTGRVERICADKPGGSDCELVQEGYGWDKAGNLTSHQKEGRYLEGFEYDSLNRLWAGYALSTNGTQHAPWTKLTYWAQFDAFGNVCAKTQDTATGQGYVYAGRAGCGLNNAANSSFGGTNGDTAASPHQVLSAGGTSFQYDARGNQTFKDAAGTINDRTIRYSVDDKAYEILKGDPNSPTQRTRFWYGSDGSRYKRGDGPRRTLYVGNVEIFIDGGTTTLKRHIGGFLLQTIVGGAVSNRYQFHDHLGSVVRITDALGNRLHNMDFVPSGERRNFDDPSQYNGAAPPLAVSTRGFTGHEHVDGQNVIHMNGRIYDPQLGRFLQADPVIQSPGNAQSWNAYTYVFNNPLAYTDPTGTIGVKERQGLAVVFAAVYTYFTWDLTGGTAIIAAAAGGAVAGGIATGSWKGAVYGAFSAALFAGIGGYFQDAQWAQAVAGNDAFGSGITWGAYGAKVLAHGMAGGVMSSLQGGKFGHGFAAAGVTEAAGPGINKIGRGARSYAGARIAAAAVVGGTASVLSGGKFANGAITAAFSRAFNGEIHHMLRGQRAHAAIEADIQERLPQYDVEIEQRYVSDLWTGRADVLIRDAEADITHVFEIKPSTHSSGYKWTKSIKQLDRTVEGFRNWRGGTFVRGNWDRFFTRNGYVATPLPAPGLDGNIYWGQYHYGNGYNGLIFYDFAEHVIQTPK